MANSRACHFVPYFERVWKIFAGCFPEKRCGDAPHSESTACKTFGQGSVRGDGQVLHVGKVWLNRETEDCVEAQSDKQKKATSNARPLLRTWNANGGERACLIGRWMPAREDFRSWALNVERFFGNLFRLSRNKNAGAGQTVSTRFHSDLCRD